jgi:hypothetical protein
MTAVRGGGLAGVALVGHLLAGCGETTVAVVPVASVAVEPDPVALVEGESLSPLARLQGPSGQLLSGRDVTWTTDHPSVARIEADGILRGEGVGETRLRVQVEGLEAQAPVTVLQGPTLSLTPAAFTLAGRSGSPDPVLATGSVTNEGAGNLSGLSVEIRESEGGPSPAWLQASLDTDAAPTTLRVRADLSDLAPGLHEARLLVASQAARNSPLIVPLTLDLAPPPPIITLSPGSVAFASAAGSREPASQDVVLTNGGGGVLDRITVSVSYLQGTPGWLSGRLARTTAPTTLDLEATARDLLPGTYRARVRISAPDAEPSSADLTVTFSVAAAGNAGASDPARSGGMP